MATSSNATQQRKESKWNGSEWPVWISAKLDNQKHAGYILAVHDVKMDPEGYSHIQIPDQNTSVVRIADPDFFVSSHVKG